MKALKVFFTMLAMALIFGGCAYNFIVEEEVIDPTDPDAPEISFSQEIQPIYNSKCVSCHTTGGQLPDLSAANSYSSLNTSRYTNTSSPESSLIYTHPNPSTSEHDWAKYSEAEAAKVLTWITQGVKNN